MPVATDPERRTALAQFRLKLDGSAAPREVEAAVIAVTIDERPNLPAMFEIRLASPGMVWPDETHIKEGKEVEITAGPAADEVSLIVGKITTIEADLVESGPTVTVRGYDLSFALHRDVRSRSFLEQTDAEIVTAIASEAGLTAQTDTTDVVHAYAFQHAQTNWDFLQDRADRNGFELRVVGRDLVFRAFEAREAPIELEWAVNMKRFQPRLSVAEQVDEVQVRGWDVATKDAIVGRATTGRGAPELAQHRPGGEVAQEVWGRAVRVIADVPVASQAEADHLAQTTLDDISQGFVTAQGECAGNPKLRVGAAVKISGVGTRFEGTYHVTGVTHRFTKTAGHQSSFACSSRRPGTIGALLAPAAHRPVAPGVMTGVVTNNDDPDKLARVKVKLPWLFDNDESHWARLVAPEAGPGRGFLNVPEVNDEVLVAFEHGDPTRPFVLGSLWNGKDAPPAGTKAAVENGSVNQRVWKSRSGHLLEFDDSAGDEAINIIDKTGNNHIKIVSQGNRLEIRMRGNIRIAAGGKMNLTAQDDVMIESKTGTVTMKGVDVVVEAAKTGSVQTGTSLRMDNGTEFIHTVGTTAAVAAANAISLETGGTLDIIGTGDASVELGGNMTLAVTGNSSETVGGTREMDVGGSCQLSSGDNFQIDTAAILAARSGGDTKILSATAVEITGMGPVQVSGASLSLDGKALVGVNGTLVSVKGTTTSIEGDALVKVSGAMVMLN